MEIEVINYKIDKNKYLLNCTPLRVTKMDPKLFDNEELKKIIKNRFNSIPRDKAEHKAGLRKGGSSYYEGEFFRSSTESVVTQFKDWIFTECQNFYDQISNFSTGTEDLEIFLEGWIQVMRNNDYFGYHNHAALSDNNLISWVYYVDAANCGKERVFNGFFELVLNPTQMQHYDTLDYKVSPEAGKLIMFPANLYHQVLPYFGKKTRWAIAGNLLASPVAYGEARYGTVKND